jgi:hypothetical protein
VGLSVLLFVTSFNGDVFKVIDAFHMGNHPVCSFFLFGVLESVR